MIHFEQVHKRYPGGHEALAGVSFEHRQGVIIAIGDHLFDKKELLKAAGFQWDKTGKTWMKQAA